MQHIAEWLEKLGMSEYAGRFAENRIDVSVLRDLTDQDLKDLGVVLGDRRKMLRAIAALDGALGQHPQRPRRRPSRQRRRRAPRQSQSLLACLPESKVSGATSL